jgi:hypothetical protein
MRSLEQQIADQKSRFHAALQARETNARGPLDANQGSDRQAAAEEGAILLALLALREET